MNHRHTSASPKIGAHLSQISVRQLTDPCPYGPARPKAPLKRDTVSSIPDERAEWRGRGIGRSEGAVAGGQGAIGGRCQGEGGGQRWRVVAVRDQGVNLQGSRLSMLLSACAMQLIWAWAGVAAPFASSPPSFIPFPSFIQRSNQTRCQASILARAPLWKLDLACLHHGQRHLRCVYALCVTHCSTPLTNLPSSTILTFTSSSERPAVHRP